MLSSLLILLSIFAFLHLNKFYQFLFLSLSALIPFTFGKFGSIPNLLIVEWITITAFIILILDIASPFSAERKLSFIRFKGTEIIILALIVLVVWTLISLLNNEIFNDTFIYQEAKQGTKRLYFNIFNNILLFFTTALYASVYHREIDFEKFFKILLGTAISLGAIRVLTYFLGVKIPFLSGIFDYGGEFNKGLQRYGGTAYRLGGLTDIVIVGIPALFALVVLRKKMNWVALVILLLFLFLSGGRTVMVGIIFSIVAFSIFFYPRYLVYLVSGGIIFITAASLILPESLITGQTGRLTKFSDGAYIGADNARAMSWKLYLENFQSNPIFGKGIKQYDGFFYSSDEEIKRFASVQIIAGGHGSYFSIMSTFGLGGLLYFLTFIFGGLLISYKRIRDNTNVNLKLTAGAVFTFLILMAKSFDFITSGNGLSHPILFYSVGFIISFTLLKNLRCHSERAGSPELILQ